MKKKQCASCGASDFSEVDDFLICDFCGSKFLLEKNNIKPKVHFQQQETVIRQPQRKGKGGQTLAIIAAVFGGVFVVVSVITTLIFSNDVGTDYDDFGNSFLDDWNDTAPDITVIPNWTQELFDNATDMTIDELIEIVGRPARYSRGSFSTRAMWEAPTYKGYWTDVTISFDEDTNAITDVNFYSLPPSEFTSENMRALEELSLVEGWTREIFENIEVATADETFSGSETSTTYTDGDYLADLLEQVGPAQSTSTRTSSFDNRTRKTLTWEYFGDNTSISIHITVDVETDMITEKEIWGFF